jgi:hypothetical protein
VIDFYCRWNNPVGESYQQFYGDSFGNPVILDGNMGLSKQGAFQLSTNPMPITQLSVRISR